MLTITKNILSHHIQRSFHALSETDRLSISINGRAGLIKSQFLELQSRYQSKPFPENAWNNLPKTQDIMKDHYSLYSDIAEHFKKKTSDFFIKKQLSEHITAVIPSDLNKEILSRENEMQETLIATPKNTAELTEMIESFNQNMDFIFSKFDNLHSNLLKLAKKIKTKRA